MRWMESVTYDSYSTAREPRAVSAIEAGMDEWTKHTCITFKKRTTETAYVRFILGYGWVICAVCVFFRCMQFIISQPNGTISFSSLLLVIVTW